jgi:uncharacterized protein (DUF2141 family)
MDSLSDPEADLLVFFPRQRKMLLFDATDDLLKTVLMPDALMSNRLLQTCFLLLLLVALPLFAGAKKAAEERPAGEGAITVTVEGLTSNDGILFVSLYLVDEGYPGEWQRAYRTQQLPAVDAVDGKMQIRFTSVPAGWFVISVLHDADSNSEMATNVLGIPTEGYGFSNNPKSFFGPPDFDKAAVYLEPRTVSEVSIKIK